MRFHLISFLFLNMNILNAQTMEIPNTGIGGVYEVMLAVEDVEHTIKYFQEFGFEIKDSARIEKEEAIALYGVRSGLKSYRLQNGNIDSHGLVRIFHWDQATGPGVAYAPPETIGQRMAVMRTKDIFRLHDIYKAARSNGEKWLVTAPIADDLFELDNGKKSFFNRPVVVRENAVYGDFFNHVFFQRYGYHIPGYGSISDKSPLQTSEFTHHDFIISATNMDEMSYLTTALGLEAEEEAVLDGDWQKGPKAVFMMQDGESHWYQGFVSPNNICGKLKFFIPTSVKTDRSANQKIGQLGITLHSFYTLKLAYVHELVTEHDLSPTKIQKNEFGEKCFVFSGPGGCSWQIIEKQEIKNKVATELKFELTKR